MVRVRDKRLMVDVLEELQAYDWNRGRVRGEKFLACSPFRSERRPSFAVHLETGVWIDSGAHNEEWKKGNLVKLLAFLRNETYEETEEYLLTKYGIPEDEDELTLNPSLSLEEKKPRIIAPDELKPYQFRHPYLERVRRIPEEVQRIFRIGYDRQNRAVTFPWMDRRGNIVNVKFRSIDSKVFWYMSGGQRVRNHVYGLYFIYRLGKKTAYLVESEIDAMYLWSQGYPAIALGGANLSDEQRKLILQSPIEKLILATDNDRAGRRIRACLIERMFGIIDLQEILFDANVKDVNELPPYELKKAVENPVDITFSLK